MAAPAIIGEAGVYSLRAGAFNASSSSSSSFSVSSAASISARC
jgi:hypothetical protein